MSTQIIAGIIIFIIVVAAILYGVGYFMRKKNQEKLQQLEKRREDLFDLPVLEEVDDVKKMHLVGQSQNTFREWNQKWTDISTSSFAELESQIFEVESLNETFRFVKAKNAIGDAEATMNQMETEVEEVRAGLRELRESEERNSLEVQKALDVYEELKTELRENGEAYGPAYSELQKQLKNVEIEFTQFVTLNTSGDPVEAREVLEQAETHTYQLQDLMKRVPAIYEELSTDFPNQLKEIKEGYKKLLADDYVFPEENFMGDIERVEKRVETSKADLAKTEVQTVELANRDTAHAIDDLYNVMEREINARKYVRKNRSVIEEYIQHANKNNRQLLIEIDHTAQSYTLNHNELGKVRGFQQEIDELNRRKNEINPLMDANNIPYSEVQPSTKTATRF